MVLGFVLGFIRLVRLICSPYFHEGATAMVEEAHSVLLKLSWREWVTPAAFASPYNGKRAEAFGSLSGPRGLRQEITREDRLPIHFFVSVAASQYTTGLVLLGMNICDKFSLIYETRDSSTAFLAVRLRETSLRMTTYVGWPGRRAVRAGRESPPIVKNKSAMNGAPGGVAGRGRSPSLRDEAARGWGIRFLHEGRVSRRSSRGRGE